MKKRIVDHFAIKITDQELAGTLRLVNDPSDEDFQTATGMLREALGCARPRFVYGLAGIDEKGEDYIVVEGQRIVSTLVRQNVDKIHRIVPYVATCGVEAEDWSHQYTDFLEHFWADEIKNLILYHSIGVMHQTIQSEYFPVGDMSAMSPGSLPAWPVTGQTSLFDLIGQVKESVGVSLTDSCLMIPGKSVSGFYFASDSHFENCRLCPRQRCPNRKAACKHE